MPEREVNTFCSPHCCNIPCEFVVTVKDDRGKLEIEAEVTDRIRPGVVRIYEGGWPEHGMVNLLTSDRLTTYAENTTYNTCLVEVAKGTNET